MKILFILHETSIFNGAYRSARILLDGLRDRGVEFLIVTPDKDGAYKSLKQDGYNTIAVTGYHHYYWGIDYKNKRIYDFAKRCLDTWWIVKMLPVVVRFSPDIIYSNTSAMDCGYRLARLAGKHHNMHIREFLDRDFNLSKKYMDRVIDEGQSSFIAISNIIADAHHIADSERCCVVYNSINIPVVKSLLPSQRGYFLYVGGITENKGIYDLFNSYQTFLSESPKKLTLKVAGGNGESTAYCKKLCAKLGIGDFVEFLGKRTDVNELMCNALAVIVPSRYEAFGRVMPEAMANRTLVIGRDTAGTKEHFDNGLKLTGREIGLRFFDNRQLVDSMIKAVCMDSDEYQRYVDDAYHTVVKYYSKESMVESVYNFLSTFIS